MVVTATDDEESERVRAHGGGKLVLRAVPRLAVGPHAAADGEAVREFETAATQVVREGASEAEDAEEPNPSEVAELPLLDGFVTVGARGRQNKCPLSSK